MSDEQKTPKREVTINDLQQSLNELIDFLKDNMVTQEEFKSEIGSLRQEMGQLATDLRSEMGQLKLDMIDAMDEKITNLKGDIILLSRKGDNKVVRLIQILREKKVLVEEEVKELLTMEPFAKIVV